MSLKWAQFRGDLETGAEGSDQKRNIFLWVWLKIKELGPTAGFSGWLHLPRVPFWFSKVQGCPDCLHSSLEVACDSLALELNCIMGHCIYKLNCAFSQHILLVSVCCLGICINSPIVESLLWC